MICDPLKAANTERRPVSTKGIALAMLLLLAAGTVGSFGARGEEDAPAAERETPAADRYTLSEKMKKIVEFSKKGGFQREGYNGLDLIEAGGAVETNVKLTAGNDYALFVICGEACTRAQIWLFDASRKEIKPAKSLEKEAAGISCSGYRITNSAIYTIRIEAPGCSRALCVTRSILFSTASVKPAELDRAVKEELRRRGQKRQDEHPKPDARRSRPSNNWSTGTRSGGLPLPR